MSDREKTLVGVLASHDSPGKNVALAGVFTRAYQDKNPEVCEILKQFRFVFTGGTYERLLRGEPAKGQAPDDVNHFMGEEIGGFLHNECGIIRLPRKDEGGVTVLSSLVTQRIVSVIWPFFSPLTSHLLYPENLALLRLADQWRVKKLMNSGSVDEWLRCEAKTDKRLNLQAEDVELLFRSGTRLLPKLAKQNDDGPSIVGLRPPDLVESLGCEGTRLSDDTLRKANVALISHDEMKSRMLDFVIDYENELSKFNSILATGTTGKLIAEAAPLLAEKVKRYHSGPKGGDIEISTEILYGGCQVVIFFVDPLHPHAHVEDIRVVFGACMIQDDVRILSNEMHARAWMDRRVRGT